MTAAQVLPPGIELLAATREQQPVLMNLFELYAYDLSNVAGLHVTPRGRYCVPSLDQYWQEATRTPLLLKVDGHWGGFALVSQIDSFIGTRVGPASVEQGGKLRWILAFDTAIE